ncbi:tail fiber assembly protein [Xenorhabdus hominickii]
MRSGSLRSATMEKLVPDMTICRTVDDKFWEYVPDYRGKMAYRTQTRQPVEITEIGDIAIGLTFLAPQTPFDNWDGKQWVTDVQKVQQLRVQDAEQQKRQFLWTAREKIDIWQDAVDLGIATGAEKSALTAWRKYRVELYRVDCTTAPDIAWPEVPK